MGLTLNPPAPTNAVSLRHTLTTSGNFTAIGTPSQPKLVYLVMQGGGGGGAAGMNYRTAGVFGMCTAGGAGGSGGHVTYGTYLCTGSVPYTIGAGGTGATARNDSLSYAKYGALGGFTKFGDLTVFGGHGGGYDPSYNTVQVSAYSNSSGSVNSASGQGGPVNTVNWTLNTGGQAYGDYSDDNSSAVTYSPLIFTAGSSGSGPGGSGGYNALTSQTAGTGAIGGVGGTAGGVAGSTVAASGWTGTNGGLVTGTSNGVTNGLLATYAGGGGGGGGGGTAASTTQRAGGAGGAATTYGGAGGAGGNGGAATGATQQAGVSGSNATGYGAGGGGGGGLASGNTLNASSITSQAGSGGNGSPGVIYVFY